jgi:hypothetical protein
MFQGEFVVQTFATHFNSTRGAIVVPGLGAIINGPAMALALSTAAVCSIFVGVEWLGD